ncbi:hypothetical protein KO519_09660 [Paraglaciecola agarilytica]|uniref:hypothetical protein n=1 Tax=Paraglaciecola chathamensis TaxID=368405 RepID=UPI001C0A0958|nr:hypothetical protein [Paraglaciecola agarilytica]MBU3017952.1 hypothetical protein [Paraglaciecola agarilytica]
MRAYTLLLLMFIGMPCIAGQIYINTTAWQIARCNDTKDSTYDNSDGLNNWTQEQSSSCKTSLSNGNGEATSSSYAKVDPYTGEFKLSAFAESDMSGNTQGFLTASISASIFFDQLVADTSVTFDLNLEGILKDDNGTGNGAGFSSYISQTFWFDKAINTVNNYDDQRMWRSNQAPGDDVISETNSLTFDLLAGYDSFDFELQYVVGAGTSNWGYAEADFINTSWLNINFANDTDYTSDIEGLLSNARPNINDQITTVHEPETTMLILSSLGLLMLMRKNSSGRRKLGPSKMV